MNRSDRRPADDGEEIALVAALRRGDEEAFVRVVELYERDVARFAQRLLCRAGDEVDDAVQETFVRVYLHRQSFRGDCTLCTWLLGIAANVCRGFQRRRWMRDRAFGWLGGAARHTPPPSALPERDELAQRVRRAVRQLPRAEREVVVLYYLEEFSVAAICQALQVSEAAANVRLHRARRRLHKLLEGILS